MWLVADLMSRVPEVTSYKHLWGLHKKEARMGCDGGTIPRRDEMVKLKKKAEKVSHFLAPCPHRRLPIPLPSVGRPGHGATGSLEVLCTQWRGAETAHRGL